MLKEAALELCMFDQLLTGFTKLSETIEPGIYVTGLNSKPFGRLGDYSMNYGVCDNHEQILKKHPWIKESERPYVILMTEIKKSEQSPEGGWRWHKWGEYIGDHKPKCEYLYDEPEIENVYTFRVYEMEA